jgi:HK97 family phage portal protein
VGLFSRFFARPEARTTLAAPDRWLLEALGALPTAAGVSMSPEAAAALPDVFACIQVIAQDVARTPLKLQVLTGENHEDAQSHRLWEILHDLTNPETTAFDFRYELTWDLLLQERAYAEIVRAPNGAVVGLWRLDPTALTVDRAPDGRKRYTYRREAGRDPIVWTFDADQPPLLELKMRSPVRRVREALGLVSALEVYGSKFFANGARLSGMFTAANVAPGTPGEKTLSEKVRALFTQPENAHKFLVTNGDVKYTPFTSPNDEAQFLETRKYMRSVVCGCFRVPPHKIGDLERSTNNNIEHQAIEYVHDTLGPHYECWSQALRRDVLTTRQYPRYDVLFDKTALIQGDLASIMDALNKGVQSGIFTIDDALRRLGMNTVGGSVGNARLVNGNMLALQSVLDGRPPTESPATPPDPAPVDPPADQVVM